MIPFRDPETAQEEARLGMVHTMFWCALIRQILLPFLNKSSLLTSYSLQDSSYTVSFIDPDTGLEYNLTIKPKEV